MRILVCLLAVPFLIPGAHAQDVTGVQEHMPIVTTPPIIVVPIEQFQTPAVSVSAIHEARAKPLKPPMPLYARTMLDNALNSGNEGEVNTVTKYLRKVYPDHGSEVQRIANNWKREREEAALRRLRESDFFELVKGKVEVGGFMTTGNTNNTGIHGTIDLNREGLSWRHKLLLNAEYQESFGVTSRERYVASYEPNYKIDDRLFVFGNALYENDRFAGYYGRYSAAAGAGYTALREGGLVLNVSLGPAFRHVDFAEGMSESNLAARGSVEFDWRLSSDITLDQETYFYLQNANSTVTSTTAVSAKLFGPIQGKLSYLVNYESLPPSGRKNTDTTSRASLVYQF